MTGAEQIIPQIVSSRFAHKAAADGVVTEVVPGETLTVQYSNGKEEVFDILPRRSRTRRGAFVSLEMETLPVGSKFKKNELVASTKNFINDSSTFVSGKNISIAIMSYLGFTYEDGYALSSKVAESTTTDTLKESFIIIPPETKVFKLEDQIGKMTNPGDELVEFAYEENLDNYLLANEFDIDGDDEDVDTLFGSKSNSITLNSPGGEIVDIKIYINDRNKSDPTLIQLYKKLINRNEQIYGKLTKNTVTKEETLKASDNLDTSFYKIGGHKQKGQEFRGVKVSYLIKTPKPLRVGDKIAPRYGAKGLVSKIYPDGSAKGGYTGNIDCFISPVSVIGRKNIAFLKELYLGKLTKALRDRVMSAIHDPKVKTEEIIKLILDYYKLVSSDRVYKSVEKKFSNLSSKATRDLLDSKDFEICTVVEPFHDVTFDNIKTAAKMLRVPLDEYVTIKTEDGKTIKTDVPVPVGITYMQFLEHFSSKYMSIGGAVKYNPITRQPVKIGGGGNVAALGNLDINAFLMFEANNIINELLTARSDHHKIKRKIYSTIANTGSLYEYEPEDKKLMISGGTSELKSVYFNALGLITKK